MLSETIRGSGQPPEIIGEYPEAPILQFETKEQLLAAVWALVDWTKENKHAFSFIILPQQKLQLWGLMIPLIDERNIPYEEITPPIVRKVFASNDEKLAYTGQRLQEIEMGAQGRILLKLPREEEFLNCLKLVTEDQMEPLVCWSSDPPTIEVPEALVPLIKGQGIEYEVFILKEAGEEGLERPGVQAEARDALKLLGEAIKELGGKSRRRQGLGI